MISSPAPAIRGPAARPVPDCNHCIRLVVLPGRRLTLICRQFRDDSATSPEFVGLEAAKEDDCKSRLA
jgi:hypothetical protein